MPSQALSDDQVAGELRKMVEFIKKEADEKAKEIELKANEEYEIEKANIVRSETAAIDSQYERKYKQAELSQQIIKSSIANKSRLKVLGARDDSLSEIFEAATEKLKGVSPDKAKYENVLKGLIEEGLFSLMEDAVVVRVRKADLDLAKKAAPDAAKNFEEKAKSSVTVRVDESNFIPDNSAGGVIITNQSGKIEINNTLDERLKLLSESGLPQIRYAVFGQSESRKFFD
ncbi:V-type proton ATPase subunit E [Trichomonascus vanleenenianus]|uniref:H(+)-transporting V1 sector ATPase subunit E n=1 Tax=Trichomonascus vanleenenianus TaxID=2268995 RepID=UPI003ECAB500